MKVEPYKSKSMAQRIISQLGARMETIGRGRHRDKDAEKRNLQRHRAALTIGMVRKKSVWGDEFCYPD